MIAWGLEPMGVIKSCISFCEMLCWPPSVTACLWASLPSGFVFSNWKAHFNKMRSRDWLWFWRICHFFALGNSWAAFRSMFWIFIHWLQCTRDPEFDKRRKMWAFPVSFKFATAYKINFQDDAGLFARCYWNVFAAVRELHYEGPLSAKEGIRHLLQIYQI